ncbi:MAG: hypothetical protein LBM27_04255 [Lactobacillaceae bacterium]|jgi:hypothetical protein|nr:hypothetical protein [Lactobacillaceae bacterium]
MDLDNVESFIKKIETSDVEENIGTSNLSKEELMYALSLYWVSRFEDDEVNLSNLTPFSISQVLSLIISRFVPKPKNIIDNFPKFPDLAIDIASSLNADISYPNLKEQQGYFLAIKDRLIEAKNNESKLSVYVSNAVKQKLSQIISDFNSNSNTDEMLFVLSDESFLTDPIGFAQTLKENQDIKLIGLFGFQGSILVDDSKISLLVFYNIKGTQKTNIPLLTIGVPDFTDVSKIATDFKDYLDKWVTNNLGV